MMELRGIAQRLPAEPLFAVSDAVNRETPFQIVFTSGTTSEPRGIVHTHRNVLVSLQSIENEMAKYRRYERVFHPLRFLHSIPLSHVFGQFIGLWCPALLAAEVHFAEQLEPARDDGVDPARAHLGAGGCAARAASAARASAGEVPGVGNPTHRAKVRGWGAG